MNSDPVVPRSAGAYLRSDCLLIYAVAQMPRGIGVLSVPVWRLHPDGDSTVAGAAVASALAASHTLPADPSQTELAALSKVFLKAAGFRSWRALEAGARGCCIEEREGTIVFTPLRNGGTRGSKKGFQPFDAPPIVCRRDLGAVTLGDALRETLRQAE